MNEFKTIDSFDTEYSADSVEWCRHDAFKNVFACGTYQLSKDEELEARNEKNIVKRLGRIYLFCVTNFKLNLLQQLEVPAVLDMKWATVTHNHRILLGVVNSIGQLQIYQIKNEANPMLELICEASLNNEKRCLALSLDWSLSKHSTDEDNVSTIKIVVSDSEGCISLFEFHESQLEKIDTWNAHSFEAWTAAFDFRDPNILYSGGDDCKFQMFDTRIGTNPVMTNRVHDAGVTCITSNGPTSFEIYTGSYDEHLRLWDSRKFKHPFSEINVGGGLWRLKKDPSDCNRLLTACMYGGFKVICGKELKSLSILCEYHEHESIAYGCDWFNPRIWGEAPVENFKDDNFVLGTDSYFVATCSFYDHLLNLSIINLQDNAVET